MQRKDLEAYISHFNHKEYDRQAAYYAPDVEYKVGDLTLKGPQAIVDFYADFHQYVDERVEIADCVIDDRAAGVVMPSYFEPRRDYEKHGLSFKAGKIYELTSLIFYTFENGKIKGIKTARHVYSERDAGR